VKAAARLRRGLTAWLLLAALYGATQADDGEQLARRVQSVGTLIETSSAARQIDASGVAVARERRDNARLMHREAAAALRSGNTAQAAQLLDQAAREMMAGVRLAKPEQVTGEKNKRDFEARLDSARALLAAQQRIVQEKSAGREAQDATRNIERQIADAQALAAQARYDDARPVLDRAYLTARVSIESLRRGDTLVRSLNFASKREEYDYEIDRNDTHRMLITVLLADRKDASGAMPAAMQAFTDKAAALRAEAEAVARRGDHAGAIALLEDATRELVRAIRAGGVYVPG
jgi:tetratricopeptide (TPR) repeat protein